MRCLKFEFVISDLGRIQWDKSGISTSSRPLEKCLFMQAYYSDSLESFFLSFQITEIEIEVFYIARETFGFKAID